MQRKRKRVTPKKRFRPATPRDTVTCLPLLQAPPKPTSDAAKATAPAIVREDTPWPSTGKMSGNLFEERNWLLLKGYLAMEGEKEGVAKPYPKEEGKEGEQNPNQKRRKVWSGTQLPFLQSTKGRSWSSPSTGTNGRPTAETSTKLQVKRPNTLNMTTTKQQWEQKMERLNAKYNLDCFSNSELDSESDKDQQCQYQHRYETLLWRRNFQRTKMERKTKQKNFATTSFLKTTLPIIKPKVWETKTFNLCIPSISIIMQMCIYIHII